MPGPHSDRLHIRILDEDSILNVREIMSESMKRNYVARLVLNIIGLITTYREWIRCSWARNNDQSQIWDDGGGVGGPEKGNTMEY